MVQDNITDKQAGAAPSPSKKSANNHDLHNKLDRLETYMERRFDELSAEINATSTQIDMAEEDLDKRFEDIVLRLAAIAHRGGTETQANSGVELGSVIEETEDATNTILDAAERIATHIEQAGDWADPNVRETALSNMKDDVQNILIACSFQDLTGQRIRKTLENLQAIEQRLSGTLGKMGITVDLSKDTIETTLEENKANSQEDIDSIMSGDEDDLSRLAGLDANL